tara:strand:+ start:289 stop:426 length:138 start_codon:yes stop_codon:yes gene_type:complete
MKKYPRYFKKLDEALGIKQDDDAYKQPLTNLLTNVKHRLNTLLGE